jgi:S-adenosylmethionine synthetase
MSKKLFASESVTEGHPDKICDQISDAILDAILREDRDARVAVEVLVTNGLVVVAGEITTEVYIDIQKLVREKIINIGFDDSNKGFDGNTCGVLVSLGSQSTEIAKGVDIPLEKRTSDTEESFGIGAGDQGLMFGYATNENPDYMPTPINLAHLMTMRLSDLRKTNPEFSWIYPDGKSQVIIGYEDEKPISIEHVLISTQHSPEVSLSFVQEQILEHVIMDVINEYNIQLVNAELPELHFSEATMLVNPAGEWNIGGPKSDAGLTGRKIIVDTYGGFARHGGGNFHGKDPSKVDRSAAYALRWIAKNLVAAGVADRLELQVSYAIGKAEPLGLHVDSFGTAKKGLSDEDILKVVNNIFDLRPSAIIDTLMLKDVTWYQEVAKYGHFGRNAIELGMPWEVLGRVREIEELIDGNTIESR